MRCLLLLSISVSIGCGTALDFTPRSTPPHPLQPRAAERVELYTAGAPQRKHVDVGLIEAEQQPGDAPHEVLDDMRAFAGKQGCDGLVIVERKDNVQETMAVPGGGTEVQTLTDYKAACIVWLESAPAVAPVATAVCVPGVTQLCYGAAGCPGGQSCNADGRGWSACDCGKAP